MAEAYQRNIIFPNKKKENFEKFYNGHLLDMETYIGGKVECINSGLYRADLATKFKLDPEGYQGLVDDLDKVNFKEL
jgi:DNA polymerase epsilon subunit 1